MSIRPIVVFGLVIAAGCNKQVEQNTCHDLCTELIATCDYEAFPTLESCKSGCEWNADQGADVYGQLTCVQAASCNTFEIMECEHAYGLE